MSKRFLGKAAFVAGAIGLIAAVATSADAQVFYGRNAVPTPYGYPVPFGFLQPNEVAGTSPSFVVSTNPYAPGVGVIQRCQYPDGWNATDFTRDVNGIPAGIGHTCRPPFDRGPAY